MKKSIKSNKLLLYQNHPSKNHDDLMLGLFNDKADL